MRQLIALREQWLSLCVQLGGAAGTLASLGGQDVDELAMIERSVRWLRAHLR